MYSSPLPVAQIDFGEARVRDRVNNEAVIDISLETQQTGQWTRSKSLKYQEYWLPLQELRGTIRIRSKTSLILENIHVVFEGLSVYDSLVAPLTSNLE